MITDILKERTADQKPRFFLHDEMKAWLTDNLEVTVRVSPNFSANWTLQNKLQQHNIYKPIMSGFAMETTVSVAGERVSFEGSNTILTDTEMLAELFLSKLDRYEAQVKHLEATQEQLKKRIDLLENPLPL